MAGFENDTAYFTGIDTRGVEPVANQMVSNGQLLIGASSSPFIRVNTLTSSGGTVTITNGPGTINLEAAGSSLTLNADSGSATPAAGVIVLAGGTNGIDTTASGNTVTFNFDVSEQPTIPTSFPTPSGTATPALNALTYANGTGISITGAGSTVTIGVNGSVVGQTITGDTGGALSPTAGNWNIVGGSNGIDTAGAGSTLTLNFDVTEQPAIPTSVGTDSGTATPSTNTFNIIGGTGIDTSGATNNVTITFDASDVPTLATSYPCDSGTATPAANVVNVIGQNSGSHAVMDTIGSTNNITIEDRTWLTPIVVDPSATQGLRGTYQTITAALTAASSGNNIFIRPGTYTENLTLKAGVNLIGFTGDGNTPQVTIIGNATATFAGTCTISNIRLQTNAAAFLTVSGSSATIVNLTDCFLNVANATAISYSSSSSSSRINVSQCRGNIGTTGIAMFSKTSAGILYFRYCDITNTGNSVTASTSSAGSVDFTYSYIAFATTTSSTSATNANHCYFAMPTNLTALTVGGSGNGLHIHSYYSSGTSSAISISSSLTLHGCVVASSNTNAITGAGSISYSGVTYTSSSGLNVTTKDLDTGGPSQLFGGSNSGLQNFLSIRNDSNTASSDAVQQISVAGASGGDAQTIWNISGGQNWSAGLDNSDSDAYVLSASSTLGTSNVMRATTAGAVSFVLGNTDTTRSASGATVTNTVSNTSNTASSNALQQVTVAGTSAGDPLTTYTVSGTTSFSIGLDNSDGDAFLFSQGTALGTNNVMRINGGGEINMPQQPAFLAYLGATINDVTGDGTSFQLGTTTALTEVFDQGGDFVTSGTFTAPITGRYFLTTCILLQDMTTAMESTLNINTSNRTYTFGNYAAGSSGNGNYPLNMNTLADMDAADTSTVTFSAALGAKVVNIFGDTSLRTYFAGNLEC